MSELKAMTVLDVQQMGCYDNVFVYLKSEADAVIKELKAQKAQVEDDCAYWKKKYNDCKRELDLLEEERRWRKFPEEKPSEEMEGEDFLVSNGYYSVVCEWRGYWNNEPFCGDKNCDVVKFWMPMPPMEEK